MKKFSIIIVTFNSEDFIESCLKTIFQFTKNIEFEVVVVDNRSQDKTLNKLQKFGKKIQLIKNSKNFGFAKACNIGARRAQGKILLFLNPDTKVFDDSLVMLTEFLNEHEEVCIAGPILLNPDGSWQTCHIPLKWYQVINLLIFKKSFYYVDKIIGAALIVRKEDFKGLGGFDENYFILFEDVDLCLKAKRLDKKIAIFTKAKVKHVTSKSFSDKKQYIKFYKKSLHYFLNKNFSGIQKLWIWFYNQLVLLSILLRKKI